MTVGRGRRRAALSALLLLGGGLVDLPVDARNLLDPPLAFEVGHLCDLFLRPVEVVGDVGYLLGQLTQGVAHYPSGGSPPSSSDSSTSKELSHSGQVSLTREWPFELMRR